MTSVKTKINGLIFDETDQSCTSDLAAGEGLFLPRARDIIMCIIS